jgi:hypothetical protein
MKTKNVFKLLGLIMANLMLATMFGIAAEASVGFDATTVSALVFFTPPVIYIANLSVHVWLDKPINSAPFTGLAAGIQVENWVDYIMKYLFKDISWTKNCFSESDKVLNGVVVHIPQAGAPVAVVKNRTTLPAAVVRRADNDVTYTLDWYSSDPVLITNAERAEISYDSQEETMGEQRAAIAETFADDLLYKWVAAIPATNIIRTSGAATAGSLSPGATGTRLAFVKEDLKKAQTLMNKQKISKQDRTALIPSDLLSELSDDPDLKKRDGLNGNELNLKEGSIGRLSGFDIYEASETTVFTNASTPVAKAPGAATAISDNQAVICWQKNAVAKAEGTINVFETTQSAEHYGDIYSVDVRGGGRRRRADNKGVVVIVQTP